MRGEDDEARHSGARTLGDALTLIDTLPGTDIEKRDFRSAVKTTARWLKKQPSEIPADPVDLRHLFKTISPGGAGVSEQRFSNVKSSISQLLKKMRRSPAALHKLPLSPAWHARVDDIKDKHDHCFMKRLGQFASARGIEPDDVGDDVIAAFFQYLVRELRVGDPHGAVRQTCIGWNKLASTPSWPQRVLAVPNKTRMYAPAWELFHPDFPQDVEHYLARRVTVDPFDLSAPIRPLRPSSAATYRQNLRLFAGCLVHTGTDPLQIRSLSDLVQLEAVERGLRYLAGTRNAKPLAAEIAKLLALVARDHAKSPEHSVKTIKDIAARLRGKRRGMCEKVRERLIPLKHEGNLGRLFLFPTGLIRGLIRRPELSVGDARLFQCALALALLTVCPLRIGALCSIRLDRHLNWSAASMKGDLIIEFAPGELKGDEPGSFPIPREVASLIRTYCERFRPLLNPAGSPFLFSGKDPARPRNKQGFSTQLTQVIFDRLSLHVNPHLYRHLVHLVVLRRFPAAYAMVARILTHRGHCVLDKHKAFVRR